MVFKAINILVIEDNPGDFALVQAYLAATRVDTQHVMHAATLKDAIRLLSEVNFDLILLDLTLPDSVDTNSFEDIKDSTGDIPVIILSGSKNEDLALKIVQEGAQDYLIKDELDARILEKSILYSIERKKNLLSLMQSREQYQFLFDNNPMPMWTYDVETFKFIMVNNAAIEQYGYSRSEFLSMTVKDIRPEDDIKHLIEHNQTVQNFPYRYSGEWRHILKNGDIINVEITSYLITYPEQKLRLVVANNVTDKVKAKAELEKSERIFRAIAESFPNGAIDVLNDELKILYTNGVEYKRLGLKPETYIGDDFLAHQDPAVYHELKSKLEESLAGSTVSFETTRRGNFYSSVAAPLTHIPGAQEKLLVITQNITEKKQTEQHLRLLESVVINSSNGVMIVSKTPTHGKHMQIVFANKAQQELTGYSLTELLGNNPKMFQGPETDPESITRLRVAIKKQVPVDVDLINYTKKGTPYWVHLSIVPVFDKNRVCTHFIGLSKDITERKVADEKIKKANERYEMLSTASNEAIWEWNIQDDIIVWSKAISAVFGYNQHETLNADLNWWKKKIHQNDRKRVVKKLMDALKKNEVVRVDQYLFLCKNGTYKMVYDRSYVNYEDKTGRPVSAIGSLQDITELHKKELQLLEQNKKIYEIAQINSHVIRKPVASILGLINVLDKSKLADPEMARIIDHLECCALELDEVIHNIAQKAILSEYD
jgi:PAS domain S-box-containing protein